MGKSKLLTIFFLILGCFLFPDRIHSQTDAAIKTLKGLDSLKVEVEPLAPDLQKAGITTEQIQLDVETKLRQAGLKVRKPGETVNPYVVLNVSVQSIDNGMGGFAVSVTSSLNQLIVLERDKTVTSAASTWQSKSIVSVIKEKVQGIRNFVNFQTDLFVNAYRKANGFDTAPNPSKE
jgi:hypothetical protein